MNKTLDKKNIIIIIKTNSHEEVKHSIPIDFTGSLELLFHDGNLNKVKQSQFFDNKDLVHETK